MSWRLPCCLLLGLAACHDADRAHVDRLSETGLYADFAARTLGEGTLRLQPRYQLWSDGAEKERYLRLPPGTRIDATDPEHWRFPVGTRIWKQFRIGGRLIETRLLQKDREPDDGGWWRMAYVWDEAEHDATAAIDGAVDASGTTHDVPSQYDCGRCHYRGEKSVIGLSQLQLAGAELDKLIAADAIEHLPSPLPAATVPGDATVQAALGYLHANCSHCHDSRSAAAAQVKIFFELHLDETTPEGTQAYQTTVNQPIHHFPDVGLTALVEPGAPELSLVHYRMARRDDAQMPPVATELVDEVGLATIDAWIRSLPLQ